MILANLEVFVSQVDERIYIIGRILFAVSIIFFYFQIFQFFVIHKYLGPKVIMVYKIYKYFNLK